MAENKSLFARLREGMTKSREHMAVVLEDAAICSRLLVMPSRRRANRLLFSAMGLPSYASS